MAQRAPADTSLAALVEHVRTSWGTPALAVAVLSQRRGPESPEKLDALADSMVAMILAAGRGEGGPAAGRHARAAFAVLREAPSYPGGFDALVRIYEGTEDAGVHGVRFAGHGTGKNSPLSAASRVRWGHVA